MIHGTLIPEHYSHSTEGVARYSSEGEKRARAFSPRSLASSKRKKRYQDAKNAAEGAVLAAIDKKARNKAAKLEARAAKRARLDR